MYRSLLKSSTSKKRKSDTKNMQLNPNTWQMKHTVTRKNLCGEKVYTMLLNAAKVQGKSLAWEKSYSSVAKVQCLCF